MPKIEELVPRIRETLRTLEAEDGLAVFEDGRLEIAPRQQLEEPELAGTAKPLATFLPEQSELPSEEIHAILQTRLSHRDRPPFQGG